jgi:hypothetical protein
MAGKNRVSNLREKSRIAALEGLRSQRGFPVPPRKAMSLAKKKSKKLAYALPPYPGANPLLLFQWARGEWQQLGRWQRLALPVIVLVALTTWEKEAQLRETRWDRVEHEETARLARELYIKSATTPKKKARKGFWPFTRKP